MLVEVEVILELTWHFYLLDITLFLRIFYRWSLT